MPTVMRDLLGSTIEGNSTRAIYVKHRGEVQAITGPELSCLTNKSNEKFSVYDGKMVRPGAIRHLRNHPIVHVVNKLTGNPNQTQRLE